MEVWSGQGKQDILASSAVPSSEWSPPLGAGGPASRVSSSFVSSPLDLRPKMYTSCSPLWYRLMACSRRRAWLRVLNQEYCRPRNTNIRGSSNVYLERSAID